MRKMWVVFIALIVVIGTAVIFGRDPFPVVQPPELGDGPFTLRVVRAINDRFNSLTEEEFESVLDQTVRSVRTVRPTAVAAPRGIVAPRVNIGTCSKTDLVISPARDVGGNISAGIAVIPGPGVFQLL